MMRSRFEWRALIALILLSSSCAKAPVEVAPPAAPEPPYDEKQAWILRLEDSRVLRDPEPPPPPPPPPVPANSRVRPVVPPPPVVPSLLTLLSDKEARLRRRAAIAVGRVGLPEAVPDLVRVLGDPDPDVRQAAAFGLGLLASRDAEEALTGALNDAEPLVQGRAAEALGLIGATSAAPAIAQLVKRHVDSGVLGEIDPDDVAYPRSPSVETLRLGVYALTRLKTYDALASAVLNAQGDPVTQWWPIAYALQRIEDPRAARALRTLARSKGTYTVGFALRGLGTLKDRESLPAALELAASGTSNPHVRIAAVRAIGAIGDASSLSTLVKVFSASNDRLLRLEIMTAIQGLPGPYPDDFLFDLVSDPWPPLRAAAIRLLARGDTESFMTVLSGLEPDSDWSVRAALAEALGFVSTPLAAARVRPMLEDVDARVVPAALASLVKLKASDAAEVLTSRLTHTDFMVRATAARLLGEMKATGAQPALVAAYQVAKRDPTYVARAAALTALTRLGLDASRDSLMDALRDSDWAVRVRAVQLLKELDPRAQVPVPDGEPVSPEQAIRPAPTGKSADAYSAPELIAPSVSPIVYLDTDAGTIEIHLALLDAPQTCRSFIALARKGFFTGVRLHRVVPNFVVQDGDPRGDGEGGPGFTIRDELNDRPYLRGTVGMALDWPDTGGSQFFITHSPQPHLDARYTVFGSVVAGIDVVDRLMPGSVITRVRVWDGVEMTTSP